MAVNIEYVRERLRAYIQPKTPSTDAQVDAFERAVLAQYEYETANPVEAIPEGVASVTNDGISVSYSQTGRSAGYTQASLSPVAYAFLLNAGLFPGGIPRARRL